jgi:A/G-specific adenine glycosylase
VPVRLPARRATLQADLLAWYQREGRRFDFRGPRDPYPVLVAEVMLQQTQASRGEAAWRHFMTRFPDVRALAVARPADVLRAWAGLGYNRRALNLWRAAQVVVADHDGHFPRSVTELERLPGIGPYTARAVAAIAFGNPVAAIDTNVRRVLGRVLLGHGARSDAGGLPSSRELQADADRLVPPGRSAEWTAALMDLGAILCRPRAPRCDDCPLRPYCSFARLPERRGPAAARPDVARAGAARYPSSTRWLRGRIVARLRELPDGAWLELAGPLGEHDGAAVEAAVADLAGEGLLERDTSGRVRLPH